MCTTLSVHSMCINMLTYTLTYHLYQLTNFQCVIFTCTDEVPALSLGCNPRSPVYEALTQGRRNILSDHRILLFVVFWKFQILLQMKTSAKVVEIQFESPQNIFDSQTPPDYRLYTVFGIKEYFFGFWIIMILHCFAILLAKLMFSYAFRQMTILEKIIHISCPSSLCLLS